MKTFIKILPTAFLIAAVIFNSAARDVYENHRKKWLHKSQDLKPELFSEITKPAGVVKMIKDETAFQNVRAEKIYSPQVYYKTTLKAQQNGEVLDFGKHLTGFVRFAIESTVAAHAPLRLKIKFAEIPSEMEACFDHYEGSLSKAWLQEEIITLHTMPDTVLLPARYAFRYMKIEVLSSAGDMDFLITDVECRAVSSAGPDKARNPVREDNSFSRIIQVSVNTLKECMQTVFEDGPKRDRRIWVGDLKLQALANYYSFQNYDLVKRGLYLYAATAAENGLVYGTLLERPSPHPQKHFPIDYCLLYNTVLSEYYETTSDRETLEDLWMVARYQVLNVLPQISPEGIFTPAADWWYFLDWNDKLDKQVALHGTVIYALNETLKMAHLLNRQDELPNLQQVINLMKKAARERYFNKEKMLFASDASGQVSTASQVWMILSGTVTPVEGRKLFERLGSEKDVVPPVSPYLYHYVVEAMIKCEMYNAAKELIMDYWGGMAAKGADTFWEVYDPENEFLSPYGSYMMNSYCHAWSCTPVYFLRKYNNHFFNN